MNMAAKKGLMDERGSPPADARPRDFVELVVATRTVVGALGMAGSRDQALRHVSQLWIEAHGEEAARVLATLLCQPFNLGDLAASAGAADERPLLPWECDLLRWTFEARAALVSDREMAILRKTLGFDGQPQPLAQVARAFGLTRERVRQIESQALRRVGIVLPKGLHKTPSGRRKRARVLLAFLGEEQPSPLRAVSGPAPGSEPESDGLPVS